MRKYGFVAVLLMGSLGTLRAQKFCDQIKSLVVDPTVAAAHWGVAVTALDGTPICGVNEGQLFRPASNNKIFTTATALALLGPEKRFTTRVVGDAEIKGSVLHGDVRLIGGGDANFGGHDVPYLPVAQRAKEPTIIADIEELADQIVAKGLRRVEGNVVGADGMFAWEPYAPDWSVDDLVYGYGAPVSALTIHDNEIVMQVAPNAKGTGAAMLTATPALPYYAIEQSVDTFDRGGDCDEQLHFRRGVGSKTLQVVGEVTLGKAPCTQAIAIHDPAEYAAMALKAALERRGVRVSGKAVAQHVDESRFPRRITAEDTGWEKLFEGAEAAPKTCTVEQTANASRTRQTELAVHQSPTLLDDIRVTNKVSQNLHAELLLLNTAANYACGQATRADGVQLVRHYLLHAGLMPGDFLLYDGSGLSGHDLVAPRALSKFLSFAAMQPWFAAWKGTLPEGGVDGGLVTRYAGALKGRIFAKTGTLSEARALSGYATAASGKTVIFSVMVDTHLPGTGAERVVMDKIVEAIAAGN